MVGCGLRRHCVRRRGFHGRSIARKIAHRLAADEIAFEFAIGDKFDCLRGHAFVVHGVCAEQAFAVVVVDTGVVDYIEKLRKNAGVKAGSERAVGAGTGLPSRARGGDAAGDERTECVSAGVRAEQNGAVIFLFGDEQGALRRSVR